MISIHAEVSGGTSNLLLLHQLGIGAIVDNILSKYGGGENGVNFLGIKILMLAIEDEIVALCAQIHSRLLPE